MQVLYNKFCQEQHSEQFTYIRAVFQGYISLK